MFSVRIWIPALLQVPCLSIQHHWVSTLTAPFDDISSSMCYGGKTKKHHFETIISMTATCFHRSSWVVPTFFITWRPYMKAENESIHEPMNYIIVTYPQVDAFQSFKIDQVHNNHCNKNTRKHNKQFRHLVNKRENQKITDKKNSCVVLSQPFLSPCISNRQNEGAQQNSNICLVVQHLLCPANFPRCV